MKNQNNVSVAFLVYQLQISVQLQQPEQFAFVYLSFHNLLKQVNNLSLLFCECSCKQKLTNAACQAIKCVYGASANICILHLLDLFHLFNRRQACRKSSGLYILNAELPKINKMMLKLNLFFFNKEDNLLSYIISVVLLSKVMILLSILVAYSVQCASGSQINRCLLSLVNLFQIYYFAITSAAAIYPPMASL